MDHLASRPAATPARAEVGAADDHAVQLRDEDPALVVVLVPAAPPWRRGCRASPWATSAPGGAGRPTGPTPRRRRPRSRPERAQAWSQPRSSTQCYTNPTWPCADPPTGSAPARAREAGRDEITCWCSPITSGGRIVPRHRDARQRHDRAGRGDSRRAGGAPAPAAHPGRRHRRSRPGHPAHRSATAAAVRDPALVDAVGSSAPILIVLGSLVIGGVSAPCWGSKRGWSGSARGCAAGCSAVAATAGTGNASSRASWPARCCSAWGR